MEFNSLGGRGDLRYSKGNKYSKCIVCEKVTSIMGKRNRVNRIKNASWKGVVI